MKKTGRITALSGLFILPFSLLILIFSLSPGSDPIGAPLSITLLLLANVLFLMKDLSKNVVLLVFQATFFVFLIGGSLLDALEGGNFYSSFPAETVKKTYLCYWISVFAMWCYFAYLTFRRKEITFRFGKKKEKTVDLSPTPREARIRLYSEILFYISVIAYVAVTADKILFRQSYSLQSYYASYDTASRLPGVIVKIADCHLIAFCLFLATKPTKKEARLPMIVFLVSSALTVLYGVRHIIMLDLLFLIVYCVLRNGDGGEVWLSGRTAGIGVLVSPLVIVFLQAFDVIRRRIAFDLGDLRDLFSFRLIRDFFVSQSVSANILPNAITLSSQLGGQPVFYTFGTLYTYLRQNMIVRFFTGAAAFNANSYENAMSGGNLGARLAYLMYRDSFLSGTGMGGSFPADLFADFSYIGVFLGTVAACLIISWLSGVMRAKKSSPFLLALVLVSIRWIAYMPRDSYFSWAMQAFSFMNILFVLFVMVLSRIKIK